MVGLAVAQILLNAPLSALLTVAVLVLSIAFNAWQQLYATSRVEKLLDRPTTTVLRDGQFQTRAVDEIVVDDILIVGIGDEFCADGLLLGGAPTVLEPSTEATQVPTSRKQTGDLVRAGTYCTQGRAVYRATSIADRSGAPGWTPVRDFGEWTPLQKIMARILRYMLILIAFFLLLLILDMANWPALGQLFTANIRDVVSLFFSIAPSGLYFMIVATYALASARLGTLGALVRNSQAIEALAQVSVLCLSSTGILTGAKVRLEMAKPDDKALPMAENRVRQILGDVAHTLGGDNALLQAMRTNFDGSRRDAAETVSNMPAYGWSAVTFQETDLRGTFVIGEPEILQPALRPQDPPSNADQGPVPKKELLSRFRNLLPRRNVTQNGAVDKPPEVSLETGVPSPAVATESGPLASARGFLAGIRNRWSGQTQAMPEDRPPPTERATDVPTLICAYTVEPQSLTLPHPHLQPSLPTELTHLCTLTFEAVLRSGSLEAARSFVESGIQVKILSSENPQAILEATRALGVTKNEQHLLTAVSGIDLARMDPDRRDRAITSTAVFGQLTLGQKDQIVQALRHQGERVAMIGERADDVASMSAANLSIALQDSSQAALATADIVLLDDSFQGFPTVLHEGQRIVNGLLDVLKISLVQIGYILLLNVAMILVSPLSPYYHPSQGTAITIFTVIIPSLGLSWWASAGQVPRHFMRSRMLRFVIPAAVTMAVAVLAIDWVLGRQGVEIAASQLAVTYGLMGTGLLLIIFVQPPSRFWVGGDVLSGDRRPIAMVIGLVLLFMLAARLPITQYLLKIAPLYSLEAYAIVGASVLLWMLLIRAVWRASWLSRWVGPLSGEIEIDRVNPDGTLQSESSERIPNQVYQPITRVKKGATNE